MDTADDLTGGTSLTLTSLQKRNIFNITLGWAKHEFINKIWQTKHPQQIFQERFTSDLAMAVNNTGITGSTWIFAKIMEMPRSDEITIITL